MLISRAITIIRLRRDFLRPVVAGEVELRQVISFTDVTMLATDAERHREAAHHLDQLRLWNVFRQHLQVGGIGRLPSRRAWRGHLLRRWCLRRSPAAQASRRRWRSRFCS